jgi:hypothetical protein
MEIVKVNFDFDNKKTTEKYSSPSFLFYSNVSMGLLDNSYKNININLDFVSQYYMLYTKDQILANLLRCQSSKVKLRSYNKNGCYLEQYKNIFLTKETHEPTNHSDYNNIYKAILDIIETETRITFRLWKWLQPVKIINFELKAEL